MWSSRNEMFSQLQGKGIIRMIHKKIATEQDKKVALVAHDNKKRDLV